MDFSESIKSLADRAQKIKSNLTTEEATKTALVLPFIQALGYDVFNPLEVVPEFIADVAGRKGEKIDYAIMHLGKPIIIIECKCCGAALDAGKCEQLHRYFLTLDSCIGVLTDGIRYWFYADSDDGKKMDSCPFMEFSLEDIDPTLIPELRKLCKGKFDLKTTLDTVNELKFNRQIKLLLAKNLENPEDGFIGYFMGEAGVRATAKAREQFFGYVKRAFGEFVAEQIDNRLKNALAATPKKEELPVEPEELEEGEPKIVTTEDEWQAYYLVKSLLMGLIDPERVVIRDAQSYCNVLLDDTRLKPLIRFHFNNPERLRIELFGEGKNRTMHDINKVEDILNHVGAIKATLAMYEAVKS